MEKKIHIQASKVTPIKLTELFRSIFADKINLDDDVILKNVSIEISFNEEKMSTDESMLSRIVIDELNILDSPQNDVETESANKSIVVDDGAPENADVSEETATSTSGEKSKNAKTTLVEKEETGGEVYQSKEEVVENETNQTTENPKVSDNEVVVKNVDDILAMSNSYPEFITNMSIAMNFKRCKQIRRDVQFDIMLRTVCMEALKWDVIYKQIEQQSGHKFTISDQQYFTKAISKRFNCKIMKFLKYTAAKVNEKFGSDVSETVQKNQHTHIVEKKEEKSSNTKATTNFSQELPAKKRETNANNSSLAKVVKVEESFNSDVTTNKEHTPNVQHEEVTSIKRVFYCLPAKDELSDEYAQKVREFEKFISEIEIKKEIPMVRIKKALIFMLQSSMSTQQIDMLVDYFNTLFQYKDINFDVPELFTDSLFMVKTRIRKAIYTFTQNFYGIEKVAIEPFIAEFRNALMSDDEITLLKK